MVQPRGEPPHVVRGTARKPQYVADVEQSDNADGFVFTGTVSAIRLVSGYTVRTVPRDPAAFVPIHNSSILMG